MAPSQSLDAWLVALKHWNDGGNPEHLGNAYFDRWTTTAGETAFARLNMRAGLVPPFSGAFRNPFSTGSKGLGRAVIWGLLTSEAAEAFLWGWFDGVYDHDPQTAIVSGLVAACVFESQNTQSAGALLDLALANSSSSALVSLALKTAQKLSDAKATPAAVLKLDAPQPMNSALKALVAVFYSLLSNPNSFEGAVTCAVMSSDDPEIAGLITGALACGLGWSMPSEWRSPIEGPYCAGFALKDDDQPATVRELIERIERASLWPTEDPTLTERSAPVDAVEEEATPAAPKPWWDGALWGGPNAMLFSTPEMRVKAEFVNGPLAKGDRGLEVVVTVENRSAGDLDVTPAITTIGADVAARLESFRLRSGSSHSLPMVIGAGTTSANIKLNDFETSLPILKPSGWMQCGPFAWNDGDTLEKAFKCEDVLDRTTVFSGRSQIGLKWGDAGGAGVFFDLEPTFGGMAGVVYLGAKFRFANPGKYRLVFLAKPGGIVIVNRERCVRYLDSLEGPRQPNLENTATFTALEENTALVKIVRQREPLGGPIALYFLDELGEIVEPEFLPWA
jgi:hypothetical protein